MRCLPFLSKVEHPLRVGDRTSGPEGPGHRSGTVPEFHRLRDRAAGPWRDRPSVARAIDEPRVSRRCDAPVAPPSVGRPAAEVSMSKRPRWILAVLLLAGAGGLLAAVRVLPAAEAGRASPLPGLVACAATPAIGPGVTARPGAFFTTEARLDAAGALAGRR